MNKRLQSDEIQDLTDEYGVRNGGLISHYERNKL